MRFRLRRFALDRLLAKAPQDGPSPFAPLDELIDEVRLVAPDHVFDRTLIERHDFSEDIGLATPKLYSADVRLHREPSHKRLRPSRRAAEEQTGNVDLQIIGALDCHRRAGVAGELAVEPTTNRWLPNELGFEDGVDPRRDRVLREPPCKSRKCEEAEAARSRLRGTAASPWSLSVHFRMVSNEMTSRTLLTPEALVGAVVAAADADFLSAQLWPLDLALVALHDGTTDESALHAALDRMPQASVRNGLRFTGLRPIIHALVRRGLLDPGGEGWSAGYTVAFELKRQGELLAGSLTPHDRRALRKAGQALVAATRMASKNPAASLPTGSDTI